MAFKYREEIVGKRFLSIRSQGKLKLSRISEWEWRSGVVRAVSGKDKTAPDFSVLVEFDDTEWHRREWIKIREIFQIFLVEQSVVWADKSEENCNKSHRLPALAFKSIVDKVGLGTSRRKPVEFLADRELYLIEDKDLQYFKEGEEETHISVKRNPSVRKPIKKWLDYQDGQKILLTTPSILVGYRIEVYRAEGTTQWYTAVIQSYNPTTKTLSLLDDTVLEEHNEDPGLIQMHLIDDGVIDSILRGVEVGITARRRPRNNNKDKDNSNTPVISTSVHRSQPALPSPVQSTPGVTKPVVQPPSLRKPRQRNTSGGSTTDTCDKAGEKERPLRTRSQRSDRKRKTSTDLDENRKSPNTATPKQPKSVDRKTECVNVNKEETNTVCDSNDGVSLDVDKHKQNKEKNSSRKQKQDSNNESKVEKLEEKVLVEDKSSELSKGDDTSSDDIIKDSDSKENKSDKTSAPVSPNGSSEDTCTSVSLTEHSVSDSVSDTHVESNDSDTENVKSSGCDNKKTDLEDMHIKKQHLLSSTCKNFENIPQTSLAGSIDLNHPVTDQIAKLTKAALDSEGKSSTHSSTHSERPSSASSNTSSDVRLVSCDQINNTTDHQSSFREVRTDSRFASLLKSTGVPLTEVRTISRDSDEHSSTSLDELKNPGPQLDGAKSSKNSPATSPLIISSNDPVNPYRDPELMRKNPVQIIHPKTMSQSTYPSVNKPVAATPTTISATTSSISSLSSHPLNRSMISPLPYQLPPIGAGMSHHLPLGHGLSQLDAATIAAHGLAQQQQQQHHLAALSYSNLMQLPYSLPGNLTSAQLELLWHQKNPTIPVPPPWMLAKYQEDLLRDAKLLREREQQIHVERIERERIEQERERLERERLLERERRERELERERIEREKAEREQERERLEQRERVEKERQERERVERERQEREKERREEICRMEREREQRQERERILRESADTLVDQHFSESLRLASQKAAMTGIWPHAQTPSITKGIGKGAVERPEPQPAHTGRHSVPHADRVHDRKDDLKTTADLKLKQEHSPEHLNDATKLHAHQEYRIRQAAEKRLLEKTIIAEHYQRTESKDVSSKTPDNKSSIQSYQQYRTSNYPPSTTTSSSSGHQIKQEQNYCLYGYQPFQHSYIQSDQLHLRGLTSSEKSAVSIKDEKCAQDLKMSQHLSYQCRPMSPHNKRDLAMPPPLIKDSKTHSSVIVENKLKEESHSNNSPSPQHRVMPIPVPAVSQRPSPKPAHTPERPLSSSTSPGSLALHNLLHPSSTGSISQSHPTAFRAVDPKQSIQHTSSRPSSSPSHINNNNNQPLDYRNLSSNKTKSTNSPGTSTQVHMMSSSSPQSSTVTPAPVPVDDMSYTYSLVHKGLVPNPTYANSPLSANSAVSSSNKSGQPTVSDVRVQAQTNTTMTMAQAAQNKISSGIKRKPVKENTNRKRQKGSAEGAIYPSPNVAIPVSTPQILTNPSPYTTTCSNTSSFISTTITSTAAMSSTPSTTSTMSSTSATASLFSAFKGKSGYLDSFKTFVENTVQVAFFQDEELSRGAKSKENSNKGILEQMDESVKPEPPSVDSNNSMSSTVSVSSGSNTCLSNSVSSVLDSINRVTNGPNDTDSDTLSAPSPPPQLRNDHCPSPQRSGGHPKLKKAWLQRHSDEDKETKPIINNESSLENSVENSMDDSPVEEKKEVVKNCYVNCSYISPSKDGGSRSPISTLMLPNGSARESEHESTSSASEAESTNSSNLPKKRAKPKKSSNVIKKLKTEAGSDGNLSSSSSSSRKTRKSKAEMVEKTLEPPPVTEQASSELEWKEMKMEVEESPVVTAVTEEEKEVPKEKASVTKTPVQQSDEENEKQQEVAEAGKMASSSVRDKKRPRKCKDQPKSTNEKSHASSFNKPLVKVPVSELKRTCQPFLQEGSCSEITPRLMKCRECRLTPTQRSKKLPNIFCRFYAFRRLRYSPKGHITIAGFSELADAEQDDIEPWLPRTPIINPTIDLNTAKYLIAKVGDNFCQLVEQERETKQWAGKDAQIAWKRAVTGVREMCDVCDTTLFNMHWVCQKCGFVVCLDCYKVRRKLLEMECQDDPEWEEYDDRKWLTCSANRQPHEANKLMLTQIIPCDALWQVAALVHEIQDTWKIPSLCLCEKSTENNKITPKNGVSQKLMNAVKKLSPEKGKKMVNGIDDHSSKHSKSSKKSSNDTSFNGSNMKSTVASLSSYNADSASPLSLLADVASMDSENSRDRSDSPFSKRKGDSSDKKSKTAEVTVNGGDIDDKKNSGPCSTLRELLTKTAGKGKLNSESKKPKQKSSSTFDDIIQSVVEKSLSTDDNVATPCKLLHYVPKSSHAWLARELPVKAHNLTETSVLYPDVPHSWLSDGRVLRLHDSKHKGNLKIFQEQWKRGQPVLVSGNEKHLNKDLWKVETFLRDFGHIENDLVNCRTGVTLLGHKMKVFWEGFSSISKRIRDDYDQPILLKLKDWPPGDDFGDLLPNHFQDLMHNLPLPEYTNRQGHLNLASRLPDFLVRPDLGPKMYNAYGSSDFPKEATTNLHLDVSDAVNVMVYVGIPDDGRGGKANRENAAIKAIDLAGCCEITKRRVREVHEVPGALWQIYDAQDADKIRDFLNKIAKERGEEIEPEHDSIHDQSWYIDAQLGDRLQKEYGVTAYNIVQCMGDAVFIPAGAPHQVRNLHSCIKVAEDFVSPEHLSHCFQLTQEFRHLSDTHSNHEDKLQVKNILYHAVKDGVAILNSHDPEEN